MTQAEKDFDAACDAAMAQMQAMTRHALELANNSASLRKARQS